MTVILGGALVVVLLALWRAYRAARALMILCAQYGGARVKVEMNNHLVFDGEVGQHVRLMLHHRDDSCELAEGYGVEVRLHLAKAPVYSTVRVGGFWFNVARFFVNVIAWTRV